MSQGPTVVVVKGGASKGELTNERTARENADAALAPKASPALTGTPTAPTPAEGDNSTKLSTTAYADRAADEGREDAEAASVPLTQKGVANGVATLDGGGLLPTAQLPPLALTDPYVVASEGAQLALVAHKGDFAIRTDINKTFVQNGGTSGTMADWTELVTPGDVTSVNGHVGTVVLPGLPEAIGTANQYIVVRSDGTVHYIDPPEINAKAWGVDHTGATDTTAKEQEAINWLAEHGGGILRYGPGTIKRTGAPPLIPKNLAHRLSIKGAGAGTTTFKLEAGALTAFLFAETNPGDTIGNVELYDFTVDGTNQEEHTVETPVIIGCSNKNINVLDVYVERVNTINVPSAQGHVSGRRNVSFRVAHEAPGEALNRMERIRVRCCDFAGGQIGVQVVAGNKLGTYPSNVYLADIYVGDIKHVIPGGAPSEFGSCAHVQIGSVGWSDGRGIVVERIHGENSGDVGIELDVPAVLNDCYIVNSNDSNYLFTTFNPATSNEPIVTQLTQEAIAGEATIHVASTASLTVGGLIILGAGEEARTVKAIGVGTVEFTAAIEKNHANGQWLQQADDMSAAAWRCRNLRGRRTATMPGSNNCVSIQNANNVRPCPAVYIDGLDYTRTAADITSIGEVVKAQTGTAGSPTGNPYAVSIRNIRADIQNLTYAGGASTPYEPFYLVMRGPNAPLLLQGDINISGPGVTGAGKMPTRIVSFNNANAVIDIDIGTQVNIGSSGGEQVRAVSLNPATAGDLSGRVRHRTPQPSSITAGGGNLAGVRFGKGCALASSLVTAQLNNGAELGTGALTLPMTSTTGFYPGQAIVIDATSTAKSEIAVIETVTAGVSVTIVGVGATPGTTIAHADKCVIAPLRTVVLEDCDWSGLGTTGKPVVIEDVNVLSRVLQRGHRYGQEEQLAPVTLALPGSEKALMITTGRSGVATVAGGAVTAIEWSSDGKHWRLLGSFTGMSFPVSTGDFIRLTYSEAPTVTVDPARA